MARSGPEGNQPDHSQRSRIPAVKRCVVGGYREAHADNCRVTGSRRASPGLDTDLSGLGLGFIDPGNVGRK